MAEALRDCVRQAQQHIADEMEKLRGLISELRPAALDELGLEASLRDLAERIQLVYGLQVDTRIERSPARAAPGLGDRDGGLPDRAGVPQQRRPARGRRARRGRGQRRDGSMRIRVSDDGRGFDPARDTEGFGLRGMRERVELLDGDLTIASEPGGGTEIVADLPLGGAGGTARSEAPTPPRARARARTRRGPTCARGPSLR